jgi:hypothetical protein
MNHALLYIEDGETISAWFQALLKRRPHTRYSRPLPAGHFERLNRLLLVGRMGLELTTGGL